MEFTAAMIARMLNGTVDGDPDTKLNTVARIEEGVEGALSFLSNMKYEPYLYTTAASAVLVSNDFTPAKEVRATLIRVDDPYQALARLLAFYEQARPAKKGIHASAVIDVTSSQMKTSTGSLRIKMEKSVPVPLSRKMLS
jgi:UDP-3-O-[3-hydroxymyristoyl] glucosamine N-acyltransferase